MSEGSGPLGPPAGDDRIRGGFPGGPSRRQPGQEPARAPRIRPMEEVEAGIRRRQLQSRWRRRRSRAAWVLLAALGLSAAVGTWLGVQSRRTQAQLTAEMDARSEMNSFLSREVNRTLLQLWQMEDVEAARNRGRMP